MYWPSSAPRVYTSNIHRDTSATFTPEHLERNSGELVRNSLSLSSAGDGDDDDDDDDSREWQEEEDEGRKVGEKEVIEQDSVQEVTGRRQRREAGKKSPDITCRHILRLQVAMMGSLFATITSSEITIWQTKPTAVVAHARRSSSSLDLYGPNVDLLVRPDSQIFVVQTTRGYMMTYSLASDASARVYKAAFAPTHARKSSFTGKVAGPAGQAGILRGAGEAGGVREYSLEFRMVIKVDAGISKAIALEEELMVATIKPAAVQCIRWKPDSTGNQTTAELLSRMPWMQKKDGTARATGGANTIIYPVVITDIVYDKPMNLSAWITNDGRVYSVQKETVSAQRKFQGHCFHLPSGSGGVAITCGINARFSLIAIGCANGGISVYTVRDYNGNVPLSQTFPRPASSAGQVNFLSWSPDGYCLFAGYEKGWATWSVYGKPGGHSFHERLSGDHPNESYLDGVSCGSWIANGGEILLIKAGGDERIWSLEFAKSAVAGCFSSANIARPLLQAGDSLLIYQGYDYDALMDISPRDASILWHTVRVPTIYLAENWPLRSVVISPDGRYVAVAGQRGLAHYSVTSGRWKTFDSEQMEQSFAIRGGMCWYQHILIAAVECDEGYELRLYSRELQLDNSLIQHVETLPSPIVLVTLTGDDSLLAFTTDNTLYHFLIQPSNDTGIHLVLVGQITFNGIIRAPTRVRAISWIVPDEHLQNGDPSRDVAVATVIFLVDGKLVLLRPKTTEQGELKYDMKVLLQNVEYYAMMRDQPVELHNPVRREETMEMFGLDANRSEGIADSLWAFDGSDIKVWMDVKEILDPSPEFHGKESPPPVKISVDSYPLSTHLGKGIILGIESEFICAVNFVYFKFATRTHLFISHILRHLLSFSQPGRAMEIARHYETLSYFSHALELLLHDVLDDEADSKPDPAEAVLPEVNQFLTHFPEYLDIIVRCTRKTEVASWRHLFAVIGSPQRLFEESLARGLLKTAGGYLLILHTLEQLSSSSEDMVQLLARAVSEGDWDLCKELARFLQALDNSGKTVRNALELVGLRSPQSNENSSFMFESARAMRPLNLSILNRGDKDLG